MNLLKTVVVCIFVFLALSAWIFLTNPILEKIETNLSVWRINYAPEKVYLHLDKPYYMAGEIIWLKGYLVHASDLTPGTKSNILYVDLLDENNGLVKKLRLDAAAGGTPGDLSIPADLPEGKYTLVAYTNWMKNFGEENFFKKDLYIWSPDASAASPDAGDPGSSDFQFFPEGGEMVHGISGKVAFKATGGNGLGLPVTGAVYDDSGSTLGDIRTSHAGMGYFTLTPDSSKTYVAHVEFENGVSQEYLLPDVAGLGYGMGIQSEGELITITTSTNKPGGENVLLTGIAREHLHYSREFHLSPYEKKILEIPKSAFPTGIVRLTLAKATGEPLAERLVFVHHEDQLNVRIRANQEQFESREEVLLEIEARDQQGNPVEAEFSLAVTDDQLAGKDAHATNIESYLLLSSDLRGQIESPGYYFDASKQNRREALDLLMMTQGWRKFTWKEIVENDFPAISHAPELDIRISGNLATDIGSAIENGDAVLFLKDKYQTFLTTETDEKGNFVFEGFYFRDSIDVLIQGNDARGRTRNVNVTIDQKPFIPQIRSDYLGPSAEQLNRQKRAPSTPLFQGMENEIGGLELGEVLLEEVVVEGRAEISRPFTLHRDADVVLESGQLPVSPSGNILEALQGRVAGLQVLRSGPNQFRAVIRGQGTPLYLLDGVPVDESMLQSISQFDISRVEILKSPGNTAIYGGRGGGGVIALFTHRGPTEMQEPETGDHIIVQRVGGFSKTRQFYSPRYGENSQPTVSDLRSTIYWNPTVKTDENGTATLRFYTADRSSLYRVVAEGISGKGKVGEAELLLEVY